jgi:hypothetical protein
MTSSWVVQRDASTITRSVIWRNGPDAQEAQMDCRCASSWHSRALITKQYHGVGAGILFDKDPLKVSDGRGTLTGFRRFPFRRSPVLFRTCPAPHSKIEEPRPEPFGSNPGSRIFLRGCFTRRRSQRASPRMTEPQERRRLHAWRRALLPSTGSRRPGSRPRCRGACSSADRCPQGSGDP